MKYNKLVRDKIPEKIRANGETAVTHTASAQEYDIKLKEKLQEEVDEFMKEPSIEELADILEVVYALAELLGSSHVKLEEARQEKKEKRGGFKDRIILNETK